MNIESFVFRLVEMIDGARPRNIKASDIDELESRIRDRHNHDDIMTRNDQKVLEKAVEHLRNSRLAQARKILRTFFVRRIPESGYPNQNWYKRIPRFT